MKWIQIIIQHITVWSICEFHMPMKNVLWSEWASESIRVFDSDKFKFDDDLNDPLYWAVLNCGFRESVHDTLYTNRENERISIV